MAEEIDDELELEVKPKKQHWEWVLPLFTKPRSTLEKIVKQDNAVWITPLLILTLIAVLAAVMTAPARSAAATIAPEPPPDSQYWSPEMWEQYNNSIAGRSNPVLTLVLPAATSLLGVWVLWFLMSAILHLVLTISGRRVNSVSSQNLVAWASLPSGIRMLVQAVAALTTKSLVKSSGMSSLIGADASSFALFMRLLLGLIDVYLIWQVVLLILGAGPMTNSPRRKVIIPVIIAVILVLALQALPGMVSSMLGGLNTNGF